MKALIFDFDGLIVDTEMPDYYSWQEVYREHGAELPLELWGSIVGGSGASDFEPHDHLEQLTGQAVDREAIWIKRRKSYLEHLESQPVLPGVQQYLDEAKKSGLKLAVASSSTQCWVLGHLRRLGLLEYFDAIVTADDVEVTKPDPALFLLAAEKLGVQPSETIVLEDSPNGLEGAKRAGMYVVMVPNPLTTQLEMGQADQRLGSLAEMPLQVLLEKARAT